MKTGTKVIVKGHLRGTIVSDRGNGKYIVDLGHAMVLVEQQEMEIEA